MSSKYMRIRSIDLLSIYSAGYGLINLWGARWANLFKGGWGAKIVFRRESAKCKFRILQFFLLEHCFWMPAIISSNVNWTFIPIFIYTVFMYKQQKRFTKVSADSKKKLEHWLKGTSIYNISSVNEKRALSALLIGNNLDTSYTCVSFVFASKFYFTKIEELWNYICLLLVSSPIRTSKLSSFSSSKLL